MGIQITSSTLCLDWNVLRPGDILQVRGRGLTSRLIAWMSLGRYSHAALVLSQFMVFESLDDGIGHTLFSVDRIERDHKVDRILSVLIDQDGNPVADARVLRVVKGGWANSRFSRVIQFYGSTTDLGWHDACTRLVSDTLIKRCGRKWGFAYPSWADLAAAARLIPTSVLRGALGRIASRFDAKPRRGGPFCSQLIAQVFTRVRVTVCDGQEYPETVSPNTFKIGNYLEEINGAIVRPDFNVPTDQAAMEIYAPQNQNIATGGRRAGLKEWVQTLERQETLLEKLAARFRR